MKRKITVGIAVGLGIAMLITGCSKKSVKEDSGIIDSKVATTDDLKEEENTTLGEITEIYDDKIRIEIGKELDVSKEVDISDSTVFQRQVGKKIVAAKQKELKKGEKVCVSVEEDGKTAISITIQSKKKSEVTDRTTRKGIYSVDGTKETVTGKKIASTDMDENAVLVQNAGRLTLMGAKISKSGDATDYEESSRYGTNAGIAAIEASQLEASDTTVHTEAKGAAGVCSIGKKSCVKAKNLTIQTDEDYARGFIAANQGTIVAEEVNITTTGNHCEPITTDASGGKITVTNGTVNTLGLSSPCICSAGVVVADKLTGSAELSMCAKIEGKNSLTLDQCDLTGYGKDGIWIEQKKTTHSQDGLAKLSVTDSSLTTKGKGAMFYVKGAKAEIDLTHTILKNSSSELIRAVGTSPKNGTNLTFCSIKQTMRGNVRCDVASSISMLLQSKSRFTGAVDPQDTGDVTVSLDSDCTWNLTKDSYVSVFTDEDETLGNLHSNGHVLYYDAACDANAWLKGRTIELSDGGKVAAR